MTKPSPRRFQQLKRRFWNIVLLVKVIVLTIGGIAIYLAMRKLFT